MRRLPNKLTAQPSKKEPEIGLLLAEMENSLGSHGNWGAAWEDLDNRREYLSEELLDNPMMHKLTKAMKAIVQRQKSFRIKIKKRLSVLRLKWYAKGVTPDLLSELDRLVKDYEKGSE